MSEVAPSRSSAPRVTRRIVQAVVTVALLVLLWRVADGRDAARILLDADPWWLVLAGILLLAHTVFAALRWRATAAPLGVALTRRRAIAEYFLAQLGNTTLPGGVLGDAGRAARSRHDAGLAPAAGAVVWERAIGQSALLIVLGATFVVTLALPTGITWPAPLAITLAVVLSAALAGAIALLVAARHAPGGESWAARILGGIRRSVTSYGAARAQVAYSAATTACILAAFACCAISVGAPLSIAAVGSVVPLVLLAMLLPISIGGWGVREGAAVTLLPLAGLTAPQALATSVAFGVVALAAALPGIAAVWSGRRAVPTSGDDPHPPAALFHRTRMPAPEESS